MSASEEDILAWFDARGHAYDLVRHAATATAAEGRSTRASLPGRHSKSLLVGDKGGCMILIMARSEGRANLKSLGSHLDCRGRLSFVSAEMMMTAVGIGPGHLSPLALINDSGRRIEAVVIDQALMRGEQIWCHPLHNEASIALSPTALLAFVAAFGPAPTIVDIVNPQGGAMGEAMGCSDAKTGPHTGQQ